MNDEQLKYLRLLELAIVELRMRIRYGKEITTHEVHDYLDALHNIPQLIREKGGWHVPESIKADLERYDQRWLEADDGSALRTGLSKLLELIEKGER